MFLWSNDLPRQRTTYVRLVKFVSILCSCGKAKTIAMRVIRTRRQKREFFYSLTELVARATSQSDAGRMVTRAPRAPSTCDGHQFPGTHGGGEVHNVWCPQPWPIDLANFVVDRYVQQTYPKLVVQCSRNHVEQRRGRVRGGR